MPRPRNVAAMTAHEFTQAASMTGLKYRELAVRLEKSGSILSKYSTGRVAVPEPIRAKLQQLIIERAEFLKSAGWMQPEDSDIAAGNLALRRAAEECMPRLYLVNRRSTRTPRPYPPYRMTHEKLRLFLECIKRYIAFVRSERQGASDPQRLQDLDMEIGDLSRLARQAAEAIHSDPPYEIHITNMEWYVVSRILRYASDGHSIVAARSMYQHWRKHKGLHFVKHGKYAHRDPKSTVPVTQRVTPVPVQPTTGPSEHDIEQVIAELYGPEGASETGCGPEHEVVRGLRPGDENTEVLRADDLTANTDTPTEGSHEELSSVEHGEV